MTFKELNFCEELLEGLQAMGFETATPVQEQAIPIIMEGDDLVAIAQTGTGKTAAFLLPLINEQTLRPTNHITTLIIVPTRELAVQIDQALEGFSYFTPISSLAIYGGKDSDAFTQERKALSSGVNIIIATPGRLLTHLNLGKEPFKNLQSLVIDEVDRMLDMGFINDISTIINNLPADRQTLMFSATLSPKIQHLVKRFLNNPKSFTLSNSRPAEGISQGAFKISDHNKLRLLEYLINVQRKQKKRILVFASTKLAVKDIARSLQKQFTDLAVAEIHSDLEQDERREVMRKYKNGTIQALVATDILARGIDVKDIQLVINYDLPSDPEDFVHRIGRTARADSKGSALAFVSPKQIRNFKNIERLMKAKITLLPLPPFIDKDEKLVQEKPPRSNKRHSSGGMRSKNKRTGYRRK